MNTLRALLDKTWVRRTIAGVIALILLVFPLLASEFSNQTVTRIAVFAVAVLGLNIVMGYAGQVSLGTNGFFKVIIILAFCRTSV